MRIGIIGLGFVGNALLKSFERHHLDLVVYDKYRDGGIGNLSDLLEADFIFLCLPTPYFHEIETYDIKPIHETCQYLQTNNYSGLVIIKSTVTPGTSESLTQQYHLKIVHNPEFLSARTAEHDFHHQKHIVLGMTSSTKAPPSKLKPLIKFYSTYYPHADISTCMSGESESMKIFANSFYAMKIQIFNEFYDFSQKLDLDFSTITQMMMKNGWINPMHTIVPGTDGQLSYGGGCFPKDTQALLGCMKTHQSFHQVLEATIKQRHQMRPE